MSYVSPLSAERSSWERERSWFNHHRLKNQFENKVGAFVSVLQGHLGRDPVPISEFERIKLEWLELVESTRKLMTCFRTDGGPCHFFSEPPLDSLPSEVLAWMVPLTRAMWWRRIKGDSLVECTLELLAGCERAFCEFECCLRKAAGTDLDEVEPSQRVGLAGQRFYREIHALSEAITRLKQPSYVDS